MVRRLYSEYPPTPVFRWARLRMRITEWLWTLLSKPFRRSSLLVEARLTGRPYEIEVIARCGHQEVRRVYSTLMQITLVPVDGGPVPQIKPSTAPGNTRS